MDKRRFAIVLAVALLIIGVLLPVGQASGPERVVHQHLVWPQESEEAESLDMYGNLTTHLPLIIIHSQGREIPGAEGRTDEDLYCRYAIIDNPSGVNHSGDTPTQSGWMAISIRGNSSRIFPKKQYAVKLVDESGAAVKSSLLGMPAEST